MLQTGTNHDKVPGAEALPGHQVIICLIKKPKIVNCHFCHRVMVSADCQTVASISINTEALAP